MMDLPLNVLILDDHELVAYGIKSKLGKLLPEVKMDVFTEGTAVVRKLKEQDYDLYIIDLELRDMTGFEVIKKIKRIYPDSNILVCTLHEEIWYAKELKLLNVSGILYKSSCLDLLDKAVSEILNGNTFFCDQYKELFNNHIDKDFRYLLYESLTKNECEVLYMIGRGYTTQNIADEKSWSVKTVEYYRKRLFDKFGVSNVSRLVAIAMKEGFLKKENL
ncbi:MAG: response regulator transcription factor [Tannerella sp.]|jgi:DNA-binding NarL/FixJ family response regulator|nr:response regulator transcription factor [Tannerella sp.]